MTTMTHGQPWLTMTAAQEQAWLNGYFRPVDVIETLEGVLYRNP